MSTLLKPFNDLIIMEDWAGNVLFVGPFNHPTVDVILDANRCACVANRQNECDVCNESGYSGDFTVEWQDQDNAPYDNVYECINY